MERTRSNRLYRNKNSSNIYKLISQFVQLIVGFSVVFSLLLVPVHACSHATFNGSVEIVICTSDGPAIVELKEDDKQKSDDCDRCPDCLAGSQTSFSSPDHVFYIKRDIWTSNMSKPARQTVVISLPDHLLPFSGAPPPVKSDHTMLQTFSLSVHFVPPNLRIMPEVLSWH